MRLIQFIHPGFGRRVGIVEEPGVIMLDSPLSSFDLFKNIINNNGTMSIEALRSNHSIPYDDIYNSRNGFRLLPPIDCPGEPMMCVLSGTGLTHKASADNRQMMHEGQEKNELTDSMKMYLLGEDGGKPSPGQIGTQPEWFYKGNGMSLKTHGEPLTVSGYADDGGEEPEIAGIYIVSDKGVPHRLGFAQGNEFSDHIMEKKNYLYLAPSKLRECSIGPELVLQQEFNSITGEVSIIRNGVTHWTKKIATGEDAMSHSLVNLEHHHFKYAQHRIPGQLHIHFFGASAFSFGEKIRLVEGDEMKVSFQNMGRALVNSLTIENPLRAVTTVTPLLPGDQKK